MITSKEAAAVCNAAQGLLDVLPENEKQLAKDLQAMIDRLDRKFKLHTIALEVGT